MMSEQAALQHNLRCSLEARRVSPEVRARVLRLNPIVVPYERLRGWHPVATVRCSRFYRQVVTRAEFDARWGKGASARLMPEHDRINAGGRRRWITAAAFERGPLPFA